MAPSRSATSSPPVRVVNANPFVDCVRTIYGWFRRWLDLGLFEILLREVARRRRRKAGRQPGPTLGVIDTQTVKCIGVRGPRGGACPPASRRLDRGDAAKGLVGRKRVALVDAEGHWLAVRRRARFRAGPGHAGGAGRRQGPLALPAGGRPRRRVRR